MPSTGLSICLFRSFRFNEIGSESTEYGYFEISKNLFTRDEIRWSEWLESMRKDVECTFGILKGRWRVLKTGIRLHSTESADNIWCTCCALHNMLLEVDGLDKPWDGMRVLESVWDGELG